MKVSYALSAQNQSVKTAEVPRGFLSWIAGLAITSGILFFSVVYWVGPSVKIHPALTQIIIWLVISSMWLVGLILARIKVAKFHASSGQKQPRAWLDFLKKGSVETSDEPEVDPPPEVAPNLEKTLEARVAKALTSNQVSLVLEIPQDTELTIMGQKWKVKKGKLTISTQKKPDENIATFFEKRTRKRVG